MEFLQGQYGKLLQEFLSELQKLEMPENVLEWIKKMSDYNTLGGKKEATHHHYNASWFRQNEQGDVHLGEWKNSKSQVVPKTARPAICHRMGY